jgi:hypothetical protein
MSDAPETFTLFPELVCVEVLKVTVDGIKGYASQLVLVLDISKNKVLYLPTDVFEETSIAALKRTVFHAINLFGQIANLSAVIDTETGEAIERHDLNKIFAKGYGVDDAMPEVEKRIIH